MNDEEEGIIEEEVSGGARYINGGIRGNVKRVERGMK